MSRSWLGRAVAAMAVVVGVGAGPSAGQPQVLPSLKLSEAIVDFGRIIDREPPVRKQLSLTNTGAEPVTILSLNATCGCTVPVLDGREVAKGQPVDRIIKPGETVPLEIGFKPEGKHGKNIQRVTIGSTDAATPYLDVEVRADVLQYLLIEPLAVNFGEVQKGDTQSQVVTVSILEADAKLTDTVVVGAPSVSAVVIDERATERDGQPAREFSVEVFLDGTANPGRLTGMATLTTTSPRVPTVQMSVFGSVLGDLRLSTQRFPLGVMAPSAPVERRVRVSHRHGQPFKILGVDQKSNLVDSVRWKILPVEEGREDAYELVFTIIGNTQPGQVRGSIFIKTDVKLEEQLEVIFFGTVLAGSGRAAAPGLGAGQAGGGG